MKKIILIGWKDVTLAFRDRAALILMLAAPFILTIGLGFVTGRFSGSSSAGVSDIPIVLVNQDGGQLGDALVAVFQSDELAALIEPSLVADPAAARQQVDADQAAAAIIIPSGFTRSIILAQNTIPISDVVRIMMYTNPARPTSVGVLKSVLEEFISRVEVGRIGGQVAVAQLIQHGLIQPADATQAGNDIGARQAGAAQSEAGASIALKAVTRGGEDDQPFDVLTYMAPGIALMFLMFTASNGGRTLLTERAQGTLPRLLISPTTTPQVIGGKTLGIYLTGLAQMLILILASTLLFNLKWGDPAGVLALVAAAVAGAVGWGMLIAALAKTPGQVSSIGSAITLTFGILGGSFTNLNGMPDWFRAIGKVTPNAWGLDGFTILATGGRLTDLVGPITALLVMGAVLFTVAVLILNRRGIAQA